MNNCINNLACMQTYPAFSTLPQVRTMPNKPGCLPTNSRRSSREPHARFMVESMTESMVITCSKDHLCLVLGAQTSLYYAGLYCIVVVLVPAWLDGDGGIICKLVAVFTNNTEWYCTTNIYS